jgi:hypothetical protein
VELDSVAQLIGFVCERGLAREADRCVPGPQRGVVSGIRQCARLADECRGTAESRRIENRQGRVIWKMTYDMTVHAGGASKNRLFRGRLPLPAGEYELHYQSDGSHAYRSWNAAKPHDPRSWGITIIRTE